MKCKDCQEKENRCEECGKPIIGQPKPPVWPMYPLNTTGGPSDCMHENCPGCKNGTCSGVHMMSCPCKKCNFTV